MEKDSITLMDGRLHVYKRPNSKYWQCATYLGGRNHRATTKEVTAIRAEEFARDWYMERCVEDRYRRRGVAFPFLNGAMPIVTTTPGTVGAINPPPVLDKRRRSVVHGPTFREAAAAFEVEYTAMTLGERNARYVKQKSDQLRVHILPFMGDKAVSEITYKGFPIRQAKMPLARTAGYRFSPDY
jgi:hypothetical protein